MNENLRRLRDRMAQQGLPALLVSDMGNVRWLSGFTGSFGMVVVTAGGGQFLTDSRYRIQAGEQVQELDVRTLQSPKTTTQLLAESAAELGVAQLGFEQSVTYATWNGWKEALEGVELVPAPDLFKDLRMVKTPDEVAKIREACHLIEDCLRHTMRMMQPGVTEYDLSLDIEFGIRRRGAEIGFSPIIVAGPNGAKPHGRPGDRKLQKGDFLTLDIGASVDGYNSDITRTFAIGEVSERQREVYEQVLKAQVACVNALAPGANGRDIDGLARQILDEKDMAQYFGHGLGHGLGMAVHDDGRLSVNVDQPIEAGQVWTIEPGVYIDGEFGVRIEDDVLVTPSGPELLTTFPKDLMVVG